MPSAGSRTIADVDRDGRPDLVMGVNPAGVAILLGNGSGSFAHAAGSPIPVGRGPWSIAVGDVNRDGKPDVLTANTESNGVSVLIAR